MTCWTFPALGCLVGDHDVDMERWIFTDRPGGMYGPDAEIPRSLNPCRHCGVFVPIEATDAKRQAEKEKGQARTDVAALRAQAAVLQADADALAQKWGVA